MKHHNILSERASHWISLFTYLFPQWTELYLKTEVLSFCNFCTQLSAWGSDRLNKYVY